MADVPEEAVPAAGPSVKLRDVALAAGVDPSVVSRVLSGDRRLSVRPETRTRVLEAAARLNYRPNRAARTLKTARTMVIGMVVPDLANTAYSLIAQGAERRAAAAGYILMVMRGSVPDGLEELRGRVDGLLVAAATSDGSYFRSLLGDIPTVLVNRKEPGDIPAVLVDDEAGAAVAVRHLLALGHSRVAHVAGPQNADTARRRLRGYVSALAAAGAEARPEWVVEAPVYDEAAGHLAATTLLGLEPRPTAIFAANIRLAIGALAATRRLGLSVPEDVSIVGFDDTPLAAFLEPPLTTVRMPLAELGELAVESLLGEIEGRRATDVLVSLPPELVVRASAAPPPAA